MMKKLLTVLVFIGCTSKEETTQQRAEAAVKQYIRKNAHDASSYKPLSFGKLDSIYQLDSSNYEEMDLLRRNVVAQYNNAKSTGMSSIADSLKLELLEINNGIDANSILSGLKLYHVSQGKNELGEMVMNRGSFYLDTNFVVKDYVQTEDSLLRQDN
jgi:monomeric isocitrate dehydrogenase